jgi:hypothetical protein
MQSQLRHSIYNKRNPIYLLILKLNESKMLIEYTSKMPPPFSIKKKGGKRRRRRRT